MFEELKGKNVIVIMGSASIITDRYKGTVIEVDEKWLKIQRKSKVSYINLSLLGSITIDKN